MIEKELAELTDQELLAEAKKIKSGNIIDAVIVGVLIGIAVYSTIKNGFGVFTFLPLIYGPILAKNKAKNKGVEDILKERNLK